MRDAGDHLPHGREALGLDQLLLEALLIGDVARGSDDPRDAARFIVSGRAEARNSRHAPFLCCVRYSIWPFERRPEIKSSNSSSIAARSCGSVRPPSFFPIRSSGGSRERRKSAGLRTYIALGIERDHQSGKLSIRRRSEFLFAVQAAFHFTLLGDVHKRPLVPDKLARGIADHRGRMQRDDFPSILPVLQSDFAGTQESKLVQLAAFVGRSAAFW